MESSIRDTVDHQSTDWSPRVTIEELRQILASRKIDTACFKCGADDWLEVATDGEEIAGLAMTGINDAKVRLDTHIPGIGLGCLNCGTMWTLSSQIVRALQEHMNGR